MRGCPDCQDILAQVEEARKATFSAAEIGPAKDFWPDFARSLEKEELSKEATLWYRRPWLLSSAGLAAAGLALAIALLTGPPPDAGPGLAAKIQIQSLRIYDEPAQVFIFQTQDVNRTFIWVEQINKGEKP